MERFSTTVDTTGASGDVLQAALLQLTIHGFVIERRDDRSAELAGPGMNNTRQSPLLGASRIKLQQEGNRLALDAELGGITSMGRFMLWFPVALGLGLGTLFSILGGVGFGQQFGAGFGVPWARGWGWVAVAFAMAMLPVSPWFVLAPLISRTLKRRTEHALTTLVQNAAQLSRTASPD